ncbi:MAG: hypothetical protein ACTSRW_07350 [Candidatus Helarchaeota archaeon]
MATEREERIKRERDLFLKRQKIRKFKKQGIKLLEKIDEKNTYQVSLGTKEIGGEDTEEPCFTVHVKRKRPKEKVKEGLLIPETITLTNEDGETETFKTDVVRIDTEHGYRGGVTMILIIVFLVSVLLLGFI